MSEVQSLFAQLGRWQLLDAALHMDHVEEGAETGLRHTRIVT
jgi:hypothetical protein